MTEREDLPVMMSCKGQCDDRERGPTSDDVM